MDRYNHHLHIIKHIHLNKALHNKFNDLVIADTFRLLALSMISVFIPIFLYENIGLSLWAIAWFELTTFIISIFLHYMAIPLTGKIGVKKIMTTSYIVNSFTCLILYFGIQLNASLGSFYFIALITIFNALPLSMYWSAHHIYFIKSTSSKNGGEKLGILQSIPLIISIAGPFIGSILIVRYSFREVFLFSTLLLIAASFSLFFSDDIKIKIKLSWSEILDVKNFKKNSVFFLQGLGYCATSFIWPMLLFISSVHLVLMGFFYLLSNLFSALMVYFGGKKVDQDGSSQIIKIGAFGHSLSMILRAISTTFVFMATFQSMGGVFGGLLHVAIDSSFFKSSHKDIGNAIMNREFYMHIGRITTIVSFMLALLIFKNNLIALIFVLLFAGGGTFLLLLIVKDRRSFMKQGLFDNFKFLK